MNQNELDIVQLVHFICFGNRPRCHFCILVTTVTKGYQYALSQNNPNTSKQISSTPFK